MNYIFLYAILVVNFTNSFSVSEMMTFDSYSRQADYFVIVKKDLVGTNKKLYVVLSNRNEKLLEVQGYGIEFVKDKSGRVVRLRIDTHPISGGIVYDVMNWKHVGAFTRSISGFNPKKLDF
jgi:hypothetical protein